MNAITTGSYCLNLHANYAPNWGVWECARELYANAIDASYKDTQIFTPNAHTLAIQTPTVPDLAQLFIIGCGSKSPDDEAIGQFGEGLKLAALAASRREGDSLTLRLPNHEVTFAFKSHLGQQVLFADVTDAEPFDGYLATLRMSGAGTALNNRFVDGRESHLITKVKEQPSEIYCKGIWIMTSEAKNALFSYNLNDITLNRDRSYSAMHSIRSHIGKLLLANLTPSLAERILQESRSDEYVNCFDYVVYCISDQQRMILADAFRAVYGAATLLQTDDVIAQRCRSLGVHVVPLSDGLRAILADEIQTDADFILARQKAMPMQKQSEWQPFLAECEQLADICAVRNVNIEIFEDSSSECLGQADVPARTVWLNERLMQTDNRFERIRTFLHEIAHLHGGAHDISSSFENSLDYIAGRLGIAWLNQEKHK